MGGAQRCTGFTKRILYLVKLELVIVCYSGQHPYTLQKSRLERGSIHGNPYTFRQAGRGKRLYLPFVVYQERLYGGVLFQITATLDEPGSNSPILLTALDRPPLASC